MRGQDGYTLIEVLVAFAILSGSALLSFETFSSGILNLRRTQDAIDAQSVARGALDTWIVSQNHDPSMTGRRMGFNWSLTAKRVFARDTALINPIHVSVRVEAADGQEVIAARVSTIVLTSGNSP